MFIDAFSHNSDISIKVSEGSWNELKGNNWLMVKNANGIINNLLEDAKCPYLFTNYSGSSDISICLAPTKDGCIGSKTHFFNKKADYDFREAGTYSSTNYISDNIKKSLNSLKESSLGKEIYQYEYNKMINNNNCVMSDDEQIANYNKQALEYYNNEVKNNIIYSNLSNPKRTSQTLPKIITNCDDLGTNVSLSTCINKNISSEYQRRYREVPGLVREIQATALLDCKNKLAEDTNAKEDKYIDCLGENLGNKSVCDQLKDEYHNSNNQKNQREETEKIENDKIVDQLIVEFEIKPENEKPSGCAIFGDDTTKIIKWAYKLLKIGAPLLVVVFGILDFVRSLLNGEDKGFKEAWQRFIKRLIAAIVVILLPVLLTFILNLSGVLKQYGIDTNDDIYCIFK